MLAIDKQQLAAWVETGLTKTKLGNLPTYIPSLAEVNPKNFAIVLQSIENQIISLGHVDIKLPLMSAIKPFLLLYLLCEFGSDFVFKRVGIESSEKPFNSLEQLEVDGGWPRNPMINSGAITLSSLLPGNTAQERCENFCSWLNKYGKCQLFLDTNILASVGSLPNHNNQVIAAKLVEAGYIQDSKIALDTYNQICCLSGTIFDFANLGMLLVKYPYSKWKKHCCAVKALMTTCGLYEASSCYAVKIGIPIKSSVSGIVLGVVPSTGIIVCYSPPLDQQGNSVVGLFLLELISQNLHLSVFY
ncbi:MULTISPECIES: glutaminase [unclassified Okeania]|uniref:glutaminase n=1 Tax=unclassified Okeania TaxID=2634635 RepID=UPI0013B66F2A|nr:MULTISPECIES: glutaminase [unclassified Okeania]NES79207.1 glutaminase A [Okeania sp. SIO1H4]NET12503.1 glutaminase A [Okeania sp. SIO1H6]NET18408.1 glutaminase A [Okeania sp. SIO1H5]NET96379.1 glutaminase A [Okeania sp. SIO1H2]